jgi:hypothetical protein
MRSTWSLFSLASLPTAFAQQSVWGQCKCPTLPKNLKPKQVKAINDLTPPGGGTGWSGSKTCASGNTCVALNDYYSQCQPGTVPTATSATTLRTTTSSARPSSSSASACTTTITITTSTPTKTTSSSPSRTTSTSSPTSGSGAGSTLQTGYSWIRAVASPNFHKYLQTSPLNASPGRAILSDATSAGQYQILDGQLVELIDTKGSKLYASVGQAASAAATILPVSFTSAKNSFGTFAFQGDTLTWSAAGVQRQNVAAWYVCENQNLYINLGAYLYGTPAGCADQTVSFLDFCFLEVCFGLSLGGQSYGGWGAFC